MSTKQAQDTRGAHLVGGLAAPDAEAAMRTASQILGHHLRAVSDGETGDRNQWIMWQVDILTAIDGIERVGTHGHGSGEVEVEAYAEYPSLAISPSLTKIPKRALGYADAAEASYAVFKRLRDEGAIDKSLKFQVSIPTPYATVVAWVQESDQVRFLPIYADAIAQEVQEIADIVGDDLLLQYDVAVEIGALTGNHPATAELGTKAAVIETLRDTFDRAPSGVERGIHLCYGDYQHQHFAIPEDLSLCVELANSVIDEVSFVHMPADRNTGRRPSYFAPLSDLGATQLALGIIDYEGDEDRTQELIDAATEGSGGMTFAVATECGMARIGEREGGPSLERLLELHAKFSEPIR